MTEKLLPCPFCGGEAERVDIEDGENAGGSCIQCTECNASGNVEFGLKENFISNWNRRPASSRDGESEATAAARDVLAERARLRSLSPKAEPNQ